MFVEEALQRAVATDRDAFEAAQAIINDVKSEVKGLPDTDDKMGEDGEPCNLPEILYKNPVMLLNEKRRGKD